MNDPPDTNVVVKTTAEKGVETKKTDKPIDP
jgi:hypothetical protein